MYLYNKNILKYVEDVVTDGNSRILNFEGHSNKYEPLLMLFRIIMLFSVEVLGLLFLTLRPLLSSITLSGRTKTPLLAPQEK